MRWQPVFAPRHASWLNQVEIFSALTYRLLKHGQFIHPDNLSLQMLTVIAHGNLTAQAVRLDLHGKVLAV